VIDLKPCLFLSFSPLPLCHILQPERSPSTVSMGPQRLPIARPCKTLARPLFPRVVASSGRCQEGGITEIMPRTGGVDGLAGQAGWGAWGAWATQRRINRSTQGQIVSRVLDTSTLQYLAVVCTLHSPAQYIQHGGMGAHALTQQNTTRISRIRGHRFPSPGSNIVNFDPNIMPGRSRVVSSIEGTPRDTVAVPDAQVPFMP
jgi:hypothetical protein